VLFAFREGADDPTIDYSINVGTEAAASVTPSFPHPVGRRSLFDPTGETIEASHHLLKSNLAF
jgi:hypothetical protein